MLHRSSPVRLIFLSAAISIAVLIVLAAGRFFAVDSSPHIVHVPATAARHDASETLVDWEAHGEAVPGTAIFTPEIPEGKPLGLGVRLSHEQFDRDVRTVHAAIAVRASESTKRGGSRVNLALVIDRSGSMHGEKFEHVTAAARDIVHALGPEDQLTIISYGNDVTVDASLAAMTPENRGHFLRTIDRLQVEGGTNLSGGYETGHAHLLPADPNAINRVLLLSDGRANAGVTDRVELRRLVSDGLERGVSLTTLGVGLDYDELMMQDLARSGAGNYYFIDDSEEISRVMDREFQGLSSAVARNTTLRLRAVEGAVIRSIEGFAYRESNGEIVVDLDAFFADQQKDLLVEIALTGDVEGDVPLLTTALTYDEIGVDLERHVQRATTRARVGASPTIPNITVLRRVQQIETARAFRSAMELYDRGDRAEAADVLQRQREKNREFLDTYAIDDEAFERVDGKLARLAEDVLKVERHSPRGKFLKKKNFHYANEAVTSSVVF